MIRIRSQVSATALAVSLAAVCSLSTAVAGAPGTLTFEGLRVLEAPRHASDRRSIEAAIERSRTRSLRDAKGRADRVELMDHTVELIWPVRESVRYLDPSVFAISNYLDQAPLDNDLEDWNCGGDGARTYDGHNGLDIYLAPFTWYQMERDAGIIVAAAPGVIRDKVNDQPERSCQISSNGGDNNLITIEHEDGSLGIYAHMRTGSLTSKPIGASVEAGDYLGVVGSAGFSTGPHLHFEVGFFENGGWTPQDPFAGQCNDLNDTSWWKTQRPYYESGIMAIATHAGQPTNPPCPETEDPKYRSDFGPGSTVHLSMTIKDLRLDDVLEVEVAQPNGDLYVATEYTENSNAHIASAFISFSFGLPPSAMPGNWTYRVRYKGAVESKLFRVDAPAPGPPVLLPGNNAYNGLWYDPQLDGEGYNIVTSSSGTVIYFYGSDRNGKRLWLVSELLSSAFADGEQKRIVMYESTGGTHVEPIASNRGLSIWGELLITFGDCTGGTARLMGEDGDKVSSLVKLAGVPGSNCVSAPADPTSPYSGLWYDPGLDGEGFNLIVSPFGSILYYYGFDAAGERLWLVSRVFEFDYAGGADVTVELLKATAGTFAAPVPVDAESEGIWGTVTVTGGSCDAMDYELETKEGGKFMGGRRLVSVVGLDC